MPPYYSKGLSRVGLGTVVASVGMGGGYNSEFTAGAERFSPSPARRGPPRSLGVISIALLGRRAYLLLLCSGALPRPYIYAALPRPYSKIYNICNIRANV